MGVACLKIEGRMKRPEYVAIVTGVYARALREKREPTAEEMAQLEAAFSRQGFTQGYFLDRKGPEMFGTAQEEQAPVELYAQARSTYESGENRKEPVHLYAMIRAGEPAQVAAEDAQGRMARVEGPVPEAGGERPPDPGEGGGSAQPAPGGTPFTCEKLTVRWRRACPCPCLPSTPCAARCWTSWSPGRPCRSAGAGSTTPASGMRIPGRLRL